MGSLEDGNCAGEIHENNCLKEIVTNVYDPSKSDSNNWET